ncbi:MAG TPA: nucleotidyltransferase family protein, partial [Bryobacteraceae bacterium]|nr:nucleotidyltransferase family protein [Bryobacteraceae bacterium]
MGIVPSPAVLVPLLREPPDFSGLESAEGWTAIQEAAKACGMGPLVAYAVRIHTTGERRNWCDQILTRSWARHDESLRQLDYVVGILRDAGVQVIALKGPVLARRHYQPPFLRRPSADLDLGVREADLERAAAALVSVAGYRVTTTISVAKRTSHHLVLLHDWRPRVELHIRMSHGTSGIPLDPMFADAGSLT